MKVASIYYLYNNFFEPSQSSFKNNIEKKHKNNITFGYSSILKKEWKANHLPSVKYGLYGGKLTTKNLSLEHIQAKSDGGASGLRNYALATKQSNWLRGNEDIRKFLTIDMIRKYLSQFIGVKTKKFDGDKYIQMVIPTFEKLGFCFNAK